MARSTFSILQFRRSKKFPSRAATRKARIARAPRGKIRTSIKSRRGY